MKKLIVSFVFAICAMTLCIAQGESPKASDLRSVELFSPWDSSGPKMTYINALHNKSCLDLLSLQQRCGGPQVVSYGNRFGDNWDILSIASINNSQTRIVDLGKHAWDDVFEVPTVRPWAKLRPGEQRHVTVNTSGADGARGRDGSPGANGRNGDGTYTPDPVPPLNGTREQPVPKKGYANRPVAEQVSSSVRSDGIALYADGYSPFIQIKVGHIYAIRIVDETNDHYMLIRVDELMRGSKASISFKNVNGPTNKAVF